MTTRNPIFIPGETQPENQQEEELERNPTLVPKAPETKRKGCPKCGCENFNGRNIQGTITFTCANPQCKQQWSGGMGMPLDPREPRPVDSYVPPLRFERSMNNPDQVVEIRRKVDLTQEFRKGALIPPEGEE